MPQRYLAVVLISLVLSATSVAWTAWLAFQPRFWFADAYAEQGPRGDKGPRGEQGPTGPPGPVGPDSESAIEDLSLQLEDVDFRLSELEGGPPGDELQAQIEEVQTGLADLCDAISLNYIYASNSAIEELLTDLNNACP